MRIYTRGGDGGDTGLFGGERVSKTHPRVAACGSVDELNAVLGMARALGPCVEVDGMLARMQAMLFAFGADLAAPGGQERTGEADVRRLEQEIDAMEAGLPELRNFILPGGDACAAALHLARCVCRRAEREVVALGGGTARGVPLLNRLSDHLFVLARHQNFLAGRVEEKWMGGGSGG